MIPCPSSSESWYNHPELVRIFSYFMTAVVFPLHLLGAYCILKHSPSTMSSVKWTILNLHFWNTLTDLLMNVLVIPCPLLPKVAGYMLGVFSAIGVPATVQTWIIAEALSFVSVATTMIFENRFYLLVSQKTKWKMCRPFWIMGNFVFCLVFVIPMMVQLPDQEMATKIVLNDLPCVPNFLLTIELVVPTLDGYVFIYTSILFSVVVFGQLFIFTIILSHQLSNNFGANNLSSTTRRLQRNLLKALILQTGVPFVYLLLPVTSAVFAVSTGYFNLAFNNLAIMVTSFHGMISTSSMILIHQPYRKVVISMLQRRKKAETSGTTVEMFTRSTPVESSAGS